MAGVTGGVPPGFQRIEQADVLLLVRKECADEVRAVFAPLHQAWARIGQRRFTARGRAGIVSFPLGQDRPAMMVRRYMHGGLFAQVGRDLYLGPGRAINELAVAEAARSGGLRTPLPIGVLGQQVSGVFWRLAYLSREVDDSEDLVHYCCRLAEYPAETAAIEKRGVIREAARQIRMMHDQGITHGDLHLKNLLLRRQAAGTPEVYVIDFDRARLGPPLALEQRLKNLKRLARSVRKVRVADALLTIWDRLRFLRAYLQGHPHARALFRQWAKRLASSGASHEIWWAATRASRGMRGDRIPRLAGSPGVRLKR